MQRFYKQGQQAQSYKQVSAGPIPDSFSGIQFQAEVSGTRIYCTSRCLWDLQAGVGGIYRQVPAGPTVYQVSAESTGSCQRNLRDTVSRQRSVKSGSTSRCQLDLREGAGKNLQAGASGTYIRCQRNLQADVSRIYRQVSEGSTGRGQRDL